MPNKCVVIIAPHNDVHALAVSNIINQTPGAECVIWDTGSRCNQWRVTYKDGVFCINTGGRELMDQDICSIWWRRPRRVELLPTIVDPQAKRHINDAHHSLMNAFLHSMEDRIVNSVAASYRSDDKALQLHVAQSCGLVVPSVLVSNNYDAIYNFVTHHKRVVMKPLAMTWGCFGEARIIDESFVATHRQEIELAPTIYQEVIFPATDFRVTVIGEYVFSARIKKNNTLAQNHIDWRLDPTSECIYEELPDEVSEKICLLMRRLGLTYGAIDLRRSTDGTYYFLEVNTAGQYLWVEIDTALPISSTLGSLLLNIDGDSPGFSGGSLPFYDSKQEIIAR